MDNNNQNNQGGLQSSTQPPQNMDNNQGSSGSVEFAPPPGQMNTSENTNIQPPPMPTAQTPTDTSPEQNRTEEMPGSALMQNQSSTEQPTDAANINQQGGTQTPPTPTEIKSSGGPNHKIIYIVLAVVIVLLLVVVGVMAMQGSGSSTPSPTPMPNQTLQPIGTPAPTPTATTDPTAGWETYTSEKYGFSVSYPEKERKISIDTVGDEISFTQEGAEFPTMKIKVIENDTSLSGVNWIQTESELSTLIINSPDLYSNLEWIEDGIWYKSSKTIGIANFEYYSYTFRDNLVFRINTYTDQEVFDQILSTFEFTESGDGMMMEEN